MIYLHMVSKWMLLTFSIKCPFKWCLVGSSGSKNTNFSLGILKNSKHIFDTAPTGLIIIYQEFQEIYNKFQKFIPTQLIDETDT